MSSCRLSIDDPTSGLVSAAIGPPPFFLAPARSSRRTSRLPVKNATRRRMDSTGSTYVPRGSGMRGKQMGSSQHTQGRVAHKRKTCSAMAQLRTDPPSRRCSRKNRWWPILACFRRIAGLPSSGFLLSPCDSAVRSTVEQSTRTTIGNTTRDWMSPSAASGAIRLRPKRTKMSSRRPDGRHETSDRS
jgi:hypothetical protein